MKGDQPIDQVDRMKHSYHKPSTGEGFDIDATFRCFTKLWKRRDV